MKTIFVTSFHASISRNIISSDVWRLLKERANTRLVLLVPKYKVDFFNRNFGGKDVVVEGVPIYQVSKNSLLGLLFKRIGFFLLDTRTRRLKKRFQYYRDKKLFYFLSALFIGLLGRFTVVRLVVRCLDLRFAPKGIFSQLLEKYNPNLVFATDVQNENDVALMQAARIRGIRTVGMVRSWDNPTQSAFRFFPDTLLVGSNKVAEETVRWQCYPAKKMVVVGNPHYDRYLGGPTKTREEFFAELGLDPRKRMILFAPFGDKLVYRNDMDQFIMELLGSIDFQVLVRFPPSTKVTLVNFRKPDNMVFDKPGHVFDDAEFDDRELSRADDDRLINSIYYSDVVISGPTSILLDGVFFDKPVIAAHLYPTKRHFFETVYCFAFEHTQALLKTGGVRYVTAPDKLSDAIREYFESPKHDCDGRARARSLWFSRADGKSSERVVKELLEL